MEYLPMGGMKAFTDLSVQLAFGEDAKPIQEGRVAAVQSLSGTGAQDPAQCTPACLLLMCNPLNLLASDPKQSFPEAFCKVCISVVRHPSMDMSTL